MHGCPTLCPFEFSQGLLALLRELSGPSDPGVLTALIVLVAFVVLMVLVALVDMG